MTRVQLGWSGAVRTSGVIASGEAPPRAAAAHGLAGAMEGALPPSGAWGGDIDSRLSVLARALMTRPARRQSSLLQ